MKIWKDKYGRVAVIWFAITLIGLYFLLAGCAQVQIRRDYQPHCVPISIFSAWTAEAKGVKSRIAITNISQGIDHAQAEALIDGVWTPLSVRWGDKGITVSTWTRHFRKAPYRYWTLDEFIEDQKQYR
jgi:hypothetical protein